MAVKPIPEAYGTVTPYLIVEGAAKLLEFVREVFDAERRMLMEGPGGTVGHAEVTIGDSLVMLGDAGGEWTAMPASLYVYVEDCDATYARALAAGGTSVREPENQFYGDRSASVRDPVGNLWGIATHVEDVPEEEMARRLAEFTAQQAD